MRHTCSQIKSNPISTASAETLAYKALENTVLKGHCLLLKWIAADLKGSQLVNNGQHLVYTRSHLVYKGPQLANKGPQLVYKGLEHTQ